MTTSLLPIKKTISPADPAEVASVIGDAFRAKTPLYPIGGGTTLDFGLPAKAEGAGLSLAKLSRVVDYPARDMTVTVEAGLTMKALADLLATERQRLPIDVPQSEQATIGGMIATNWNGPRRYGQGTVRDYVIGISAIDGRGMPFKGGGRVVKNVAGYDFCKLLTGSLGTLGVITQVTLKLKPQCDQTALVACAVSSASEAEKLLAAIVRSETVPMAVELLVGPSWQVDPALAALDRPSAAPLYLVVGLEGMHSEVEWMTRQLLAEWEQLGITSPLVVGDSADLWRRLVEFSAAGESPLVLKASIAPSGVTAMVEAARQVDSQCSIQAHAGNGIVVMRFSQFPANGLSRTLVGQLQPVAMAHGGNIVVLSNPSGAEMTHQSVWGGIDAPFGLMSEVKRRFDPADILNRGRFVYV